MNPGKVRIACFVVISAMAVRVSWLTVAYLYDLGDVRRHHVESAGYLFVISLALLAAWFIRQAPPEPTESRPIGLAASGAVVAVGLLLFFRVLGIGFLSDDFALFAWASAFDLFPSTWTYIRPLPLALWWGIGQIAPGPLVPPVLHAVNLALHIANALMVTKIGLQVGMSRHRALLSALLFVVLPLGVETIAWTSGVFDALSATLVLLSVLAALCLPVGWRSGAIVLALTVLGLATKETAVVTPVIAMLAIFAAGGTAARYRLLALSAAVCAVYAAARLMTPASAGLLEPLTGYALKEMLTRPFAALALPLHERVIDEWPIVPLIVTAALPLVFACTTLTWRQRPAAARRSLAFGAWILVAVAPLLATMFVGPDLQGSRYLYLSTVAWALLLGDALPLRTPRPRAFELVIASAVVMLLGASTRASLSHWTEAARIRNEVLQHVATLPCTTESQVTIAATNRGAYVFRNGLTEALHMQGIDAVPGPNGSTRVAGCLLTPTENDRPE